MVQCLTTSQVSAQIETLTRNATERLILVSPYLLLSQILVERLHEVDQRGTEITIVYGKDELREDQRAILSELSGLELYFHKNLHAKCYCNSQGMVITSMNLYEFSEKNNWEMGVYVTAGEEIYLEARREIDSIIKATEQVRLNGKTRKNTADNLKALLGIVRKNGNSQSRYRTGDKSKKNKKGSTRSRSSNGRRSKKSRRKPKGCCIRCGYDIPFNPSRPFCRECYLEWAEWENPDYEETTCHSCGREWRTTMTRPLCMPCFKKQVRA